ncbi:MFS transporter [Xenorhabdus sp. Reich]|uniref:MFS transporter n=1 Tax=Xenorhabdus littoralis TaxID=2582835 RepID=A0ABU4SM52_9GAMM|nr:MFS transporter [Xenorhabdus sp. Reich]MDX7999733.1 MFS transporter [Xenorhabdus sp. Reich]
MTASFNKSYMVSIILGASLVGLAMGYTLPMVSLKLAGQKQTSTLLGIISALPAVGMLISSMVIPTLSRLYSLNKLLSFSLLLLTVSTVFSTYLNQVYYLALPRFLMGFACGVIVVVGESWVSANTTDKYKGTLMGLYASAFTGCQLLGPLLISLFGIISFIPAILLSMLSLLCIALILINPSASISSQTEEEKRGFPIFPLIMSAPCLIIGVICFSSFDAVALSMFPLYGLSLGIPEKITITLITLIFLGDAIFQVPIGWLADKTDLKRMHIICGVIFTLSLLALPFTVNSIFLWIDVIVMGAFGGGIYTLSLVRAGKKYSGQMLIAINALFGIVWGVGSLTGPLVTGIAMDLFDEKGFIITLSSVGLLFILSHWFPNKPIPRGEQLTISATKE